MKTFEKRLSKIVSCYPHLYDSPCRDFRDIKYAEILEGDHEGGVTRRGRGFMSCLRVWPFVFSQIQSL